ncbi:MAG: amidase family protein [Pirellulales bacterium]
MLRTQRGLELGEVLAPVASEAGAPLGGEILRGMTAQDELLQTRLLKNREEALSACTRKIEELGLEAALLDVEHLFDGGSLVFYFLGGEPVGWDALTQEFAEAYDAQVQFRALATPSQSAAARIAEPKKRPDAATALQAAPSHNSARPTSTELVAALGVVLSCESGPALIASARMMRETSGSRPFPLRRQRCRDVMPPLVTIAAAGELLRRQELTPVDLLTQCLKQIDAFDAEVRAWVTVDREGARAAAEVAAKELASGVDRGPMHGIPIGVKDIIDVRGLPTLAGAKVRPSTPALKDAFVVSKLRDAGAVILGKAATTEFASFDPSPTRNPWNQKRTPGGSSAGSAAAPACGMCFAALGTQTGGSIIRPASYCGVSSIKPTWGRLSLQGIVPLAYHLDHPGVLARNVGDLELTYRAMTGFDANDACSLRGTLSPASSDMYQTEIDVVGAPRLGVVRDYFFDRSTDNVRKGVTDAMDRMRRNGSNRVGRHVAEGLRRRTSLASANHGRGSRGLSSRNILSTPR